MRAVNRRSPGQSKAQKTSDEEGRADLQAIQLSAKDIVVGIAASGRTPYVLGAVQYANEMQAVTVGISCNSPAPLLELARIKIRATSWAGSGYWFDTSESWNSPENGTQHAQYRQYD